MTHPPLTAEVNFDGIVGPTHNYSGLSLGNLASIANAAKVSNPKKAALQGLAKMRALIELGIPQGVIPPPQRPDPSALRALGLAGPADMTRLAAIEPSLVAQLMSASSMWTANAATVSPSLDTTDRRLHLTTANLSSTVHRSFESVQTKTILEAIFGDPERFVVHPALPAAAAFADEGAANHGRACISHDQPGVHVFVYGRESHEPILVDGFPRRQTKLAAKLIGASHGLNPDRVLFARQSPEAIDAGAFHNDVVSVINENVLFAHQQAFDDQARLVAELAELIPEFCYIEVPAAAVSLEEAVTSYLFNSQLLTLADGSMTLIAPTEVTETTSTRAYLDQLLTQPDTPINAVKTFDLRESMHNGGGPACLRLRVVMSPEERQALSGNCILDEPTLGALESWVDNHYRNELKPDDLLDPALVEESHVALDELTQILGLGSLYPFQS